MESRGDRVRAESGSIHYKLGLALALTLNYVSGVFYLKQEL
jgi:hypothetical protein